MGDFYFTQLSNKIKKKHEEKRKCLNNLTYYIKGGFIDIGTTCTVPTATQNFTKLELTPNILKKICWYIKISYNFSIV